MYRDSNRRPGRIGLLLLVVVLAAAAVVAGAKGAGEDGAPGEPASMARVDRLRGKVEWRPDGASRWEPASPGMVLSLGDWVRTVGKGSFVEIAYPAQQARLLVEADTLLQVGGSYRSIPEAATGASRGEEGVPAFRAALLRVGALWAEVASRVSRVLRFEIATPTAVAGVRGTQFRLEVDEDGGTRLLVREGLVELATPSGKVLVGAGEEASTNGGGLRVRGRVTDSLSNLAREADDTVDEWTERLMRAGDAVVPDTDSLLGEGPEALSDEVPSDTPVLSDDEASNDDVLPEE
ncbi:FecR family protein [Limnochorda pilosa]|uniref:FecR protein domain-containing protein n=1 Tax=Limnochorda pilosa TaxID=1555112 RepID=A0A0K2SIH9_LIMPI|nr:FecR domain-containing protein [Limnochorda pilosa]BAS26913.1 hypothetical protein LIP_1056 [Limnochorda pilosa]